MNNTTATLPAYVIKCNKAQSDVRPAFQLGTRQLATWATLTDAQRREANILMVSVSATAALKAVR